MKYIDQYTPYSSGHLKAGGFTLKRKETKRKCEVCGKEFIHSMKLTCGDKCRRERIRRVLLAKKLKKN